MFNKNHKSVSVRIALVLVLIAAIFGVMPARASAETISTTASEPNFFNDDGTLKLDGSASASFQAENWDVQLDPERGPVFSPKNREALSPLSATTIGNWSALGSNPAGTDGAISYSESPSSTQVFAIVISGTDVYVGGCFKDAGGNPTADFVAKWDGVQWSGLGNNGSIPADGAIQHGCVKSINVSGSNVYIGAFGEFKIGNNPNPLWTAVAKWDGMTWSSVGNDGAGGSSIPFGRINAIMVSGSAIYFGGNFTDVKNGATTLTEADYIAKWDTLTGNWSALGNNGLGNGALNNPGGVEVQTIASNGTDIYVGGRFTQVWNGLNIVSNASYLAKWSTATSTWSGIGSDGLGGSSINGAVNTIATSGSGIYIGGSFTDVKNGAATLTAADYVAYWDGANWSALGSNGSGNGALFAEVPNAFVTSIVVNGRDVYVAGNINVNNNGVVITAADYVAKWDDTNWSALGSNGNGNGSLNNGIYSLANSGDKLYAGGVFRDVNNNGTVLNTADYIAAYAIGDGIFRVAPDGAATPSCGKDWSTPCDLQYALTSLASSGDELWVKTGTYKPTSGTDRTVSFVLKNGVAIYGGFAGTETLLTQRDPSTNVTILSGDIGAAGNADNSGHVVIGSGTNGTAVLDGFIVTAGNANFGGGMYNNGGSPSVENVIFTSNSANAGGGMYNTNSSPSLINVTFDDNSANSSSGGGMYNVDSSNPNLLNVTFSANTASFGGGMHNNASSPSLTNVTFSGNIGTEYGGGIFNIYGSNPILRNVTFNENKAYNYYYGGPDGGVSNWESSNPIIINSILWGNSGEQIGDNNSSVSVVTNSIVQGGYVGTDNLDVNPLLGALADNGGFTQTMALFSGSPAINAGDDANCPATDQRGVTRPQGGQCDIGAYEFTSAPSGALTSWNNTFSWTGVTGATWYLVQVQAADDTVVLQKWYTADSVGCSGDLICAVSPAETLNLSNGNYKWRILDYGDYGYGSWTPYTNFNLNAACYALTTNVSPAGSGMVSASSQNCSGGYISGTVVQLTAVPNSGYTFANWSGNASGTSNPVSITMDANKSVTANMLSLGATLIAPAGEQTSWSNTFSWIGISGTSWYLVQVQSADDTVILQKWYTADAVGCSGDLSCSVSPAETLNLTNGDYKWRILDYGDYGYGSWTPYTNFNLNAACYTLTTNVSPASSGNITTSAQNCSGGYLSGTVVQLTALPNSGYAFASWSGDATGISNPVSVIMNANKNVTANLTALGAALIAPAGALTIWDNTFSWTGITGATWYLVQTQTNDDTVILQKWYTADAAGCAGDLSCVVLPDETLNMTNGDYKWRILDYGGYGYGNWTPYTNFNLNAACYTLTTNVSPAGSGMVSASAQNCSGGYLSGTVVQVSAVPNSGSAFTVWSGDATGTTNPFMLVMDANKNVTANLTALGVTLIAPAGSLTSWDNTFNWTGFSNATWYLVQVQSADDTVVLQQWYTAAAAGCAGGTACAIVPPETASLANGAYKWRILDYGDYGYGNWSPYTTFILAR